MEQRMNQEEISKKAEECFQSLFTNEFTFSTELHRENFADWDSLHHIQLLVELEKCFGFRFDGATATVLTSVDNITTEVSARLN
jgi:acyl carrier protein